MDVRSMPIAVHVDLGDDLGLLVGLNNLRLASVKKLSDEN